jgi:hypothetical protein
MKRLLMLSVVALFVTGCASPDINPPQPRANTGYVDLYANPDDDLSWQVEQSDPNRNRFERVYSNVKYLEGPILRLAFKPGPHRIRVTFLNRVVSAPGECNVTVLDGRIAPVQVTLMKTGTSTVLTPEISRGGTAYGRYGRRTKFESSETSSVTLSLSSLEPQPYQPKERMPYAH